MSELHHIVFKNGTRADLVNGRHCFFGIVIAAGRIVAGESDLDPPHTASSDDLSGRSLMPDIIETRAVVSTWIGCPHGHKMQVPAGAAMAPDVQGPLTSKLELVPNRGEQI